MECIFHRRGFVCRGQVKDLILFLRTLSAEATTLQQLVGKQLC
jgi:hypothetical protein